MRLDYVNIWMLRKVPFVHVGGTTGGNVANLLL